MSDEFEFDWDSLPNREARQSNFGKSKTSQSAQRQRRYLSKRHAEKREESLENCDCSGCDTCRGFVPGCFCDRVRLEYFENIVREDLDYLENNHDEQR